jgi:hypothetical protein
VAGEAAVSEPLTVWCRRPRCHVEVACVGEFPVRCPQCGRPGSWTTFRPVTEPETPFHTSVDDKRFLSTLKIDGAD